MPSAEVGQVVSSTEIESLRFNHATVDALLQAAGAGALTPVPHGVRVYKLRYTTQDQGRAVEATGVVSVPWDDGQQQPPTPLVTFLHGTTGFTNACAPTRSLDLDAASALLILSSQGLAVAAPDYIGLDADAPVEAAPMFKHVYLGLEQAAIGSLDVLRAAQRLAPELDPAVPLTGQVVLWGGSQGGHAVFAAERLWPHYAPELEVIAALALVPATDIVGLARFGLGAVNDATGPVAACLATMRTWYQGPPLAEILTDDEPWRFASRLEEAVYGGCDPGTAFDGVAEVDDVFLQAFIDGVAEGRQEELEPWSCYMRENSLATTSVPRTRTDTPFLFVTAELDTLVSVEVEHADFARLCGQGYRLDHLECAGARHTEGSLWSVPEQIAWVTSRLAGAPIPAEELCRLADPVRCQAQPE